MFSLSKKKKKAIPRISYAFPAPLGLPSPAAPGRGLRGRRAPGLFTRPADRPGLFLLPEPVSIIKLFFLIVGLQRHVGDFPRRWGEGALLNPSLTLRLGHTARAEARDPQVGRRYPASPSRAARLKGTRAQASRAPGRTGRRLHLRRRFRPGGTLLCRRLPVRASPGRAGIRRGGGAARL